MKLIYTHENKILVDSAKNLLADKGIDSIIKNEFSSSGVGELAPIDTWPEVWVSDDDFTESKNILDSFLNASLGKQWTCHACGEINESTFDVCWNCQANKE